MARNIGVHEMTLGRWVKDARDKGKDTGKAPLTADERAELERLRAESTELRMQVELPRRVATWFAKHQQ